MHAHAHNPMDFKHAHTTCKQLKLTEYGSAVGCEMLWLVWYKTFVSSDQNLASMPSYEEPPDSGHAMHEFLIHAGQVFEEAHFLASSIPNASTEASQHAILQLETIEFVFNTMEMGFDSDSITPMKHDLNTI